MSLLILFNGPLDIPEPPPPNPIAVYGGILHGIADPFGRRLGITGVDLGTGQGGGNARTGIR